MSTFVPCHSVIEMDTGHSPVLAQPEALAGYLPNIAAPVEAVA